MAAVIEQNNDDKGIIWPMEIAPYHVIIVPVNVLDETVMNIAQNMYEKLIEANVEVILDDRNERAGVKFNDADLIGIPIRINIGRKAAEGLVEFKLRDGNEVITMPVDEALEKILLEVKNNKSDIE
jgi:prolyl-tRNA synthetase